MTKKERKIALGKLRKKFQEEEQALLDSASPKEREELGKPLKLVDHLTKFTANGNNYIVRDTLTLGRFQKFELMQIEVAWGTTFLNLFENLSKAYGALNGNPQRPADAAVTLYNIMDGVKANIDERVNPVLIIASLFISREGEDLRSYDPKLTEEKIEDWVLEGIAADSLFRLAFSLVNVFTPIYEEISADISGKTITELKAKATMKEEAQ